MSNDEHIGLDNVSIEALKTDDKIIHYTIINTYKKCIRKKEIPEKMERIQINLNP